MRTVRWNRRDRNWNRTVLMFVAVGWILAGSAWAGPAGSEFRVNTYTAGDQVNLVRDPSVAAQDADLVVTDVWASMGQEEEQARRARDFAAYQVNGELMSMTATDSLFMHCLPAHRGEEVAAEVIDGPRSVVWDEAENRLHAQKALLEFLLSG